MVRRQSSGAATERDLAQDFMAFYQPLDTLLLRHRSIPQFREYPLAGDKQYGAPADQRGMTSKAIVVRTSFDANGTVPWNM